MKNFLDDIFGCIRIKKGYFIILILATIVAIVLGVFASINFSSGFLTIDLSNIAYIKFLKGDTGMMSMIFSSMLSLMIFFIIIWLCHSKSFLVPISIMFYLYLVYSQTVILVSLVMIYGFFNCVILAMLLLVYILITWLLFVLAMLHMSCNIGEDNFFRSCCNIQKCKFSYIVILIILTTLIFSFVITILKNFVILLVY